MANISKRGGKWRVQVNKRGVRESRTFTNKTDAKAWGIKRDSELDATGGERYWRGKDKTLRDALEKYAYEVTPEKASNAWESRRIDFLMKDPISDILLSDIDTPDMREWVTRQSRRVKSSTINRDLNILSNVFRYCVKEWVWMERSPTTDLTRPKDPPPRSRRITEDEIKRILWVCEYEQGGVPVTVAQLAALYFEIGIETAMRLSEIHSITRETFFPAGEYVLLLSDKSAKLAGTGKRKVPISKRAAELISLKIQCDIEKPLYNISKAFETAVKRAAIKDLHFHDTRHEAVTRMAGKMDALKLANITGHRDLNFLLKVYYNPEPSEIAAYLNAD